MSDNATYPCTVGTFQDEATKREVAILMREDMQFAATVDGHQLVAATYAGLTDAIKEVIRQGADLWRLMVFVTAKGGSISGYTADDANIFVRLGFCANKFWVAKIGDVWYKAEWSHYNESRGYDVRYEKKAHWHVGEQAHFDGSPFQWGEDLFIPYSNLLWATLTVTAENLGALSAYLEASLATVKALEASANDSERDLAGLPFTAPRREGVSDAE